MIRKYINLGPVKTLVNFLQALDERTRLLNEIRSLQEMNHKYRADINRLKHTITYLKCALKTPIRNGDKLHRQSRRNNVVILGIPMNYYKDDQINLLETIEKAFNYSLQPIIQSSYRNVREDQNSTHPTYVMQFYNHAEKMKFCKYMWTAHFNDSVFGGTGKVNIFVNHHISPLTYRLLNAARNLKMIGYQRIWVNNGLVQAQKNRNDKALVLRTLSQIYSLLKEHNIVAFTFDPTDVLA